MSYIQSILNSLNSRIFRNRRITTAFVCYLYILTNSACQRVLVEGNEKMPTHFSIQVPTEVKTVMRGVPAADSIKAFIALPGQLAREVDTLNYSFKWGLLPNDDVLSNMPYLTINDFDKLPVDKNTILLTVKEKSTGIVEYVTTDVFITTPTREGWVILGEKSGTTQIGMLAYTNEGYKKYIDVNADLAKNIAVNGKPVSIRAVGSDQPYGWSKLQWIGLTTDQEIKMISSMEMQVDPTMSQALTQLLAPSVSNPIVLEKIGYTNFLASKQSDIYHFSIYDMTLGYTSGQLMNVNKTSGGSQIFPASTVNIQSAPGPPENSASFYGILYDLDNGIFVGIDPYHSVSQYNLSLQLPFSLKGFQLKAMRNQMGATGQSDLIFALLHDSTTKETYLIQFLTNGILKDTRKISFTEAEAIVSSRFIEIDYTTGYVIYEKGNAVFAYDPAAGQSFQLIDFGNNAISLLKFVHYNQGSSTLPGRADIYDELFKRLIVCTYDPLNADNSGTFHLYQTVLGHQPAILETEESGFPKIVDTDFVPIH